MLAIVVRSPRPTSASGSCVERLERVERRHRRWLKATERSSVPTPASIASASGGGGRAQRAGARAQLARRAARCRAGRAAGAGTRGCAAPAPPAPPRSTPAGRAARRRRSASNVVSRLRNSDGLLLGDRRHVAGRAPQRLEEARRAASPGRTRLRITGVRSRRSGPQRLEQPVEVRAAAGEAVAELAQVLLLGRPAWGRRTSAGTRRTRRAPASPGAAGSSAVLEALRRVALRQLHVLQAQDGARADEHRGVDRQRLDGASRACIVQRRRVTGRCGRRVGLDRPRRRRRACRRCAPRCP